MYTLFCLIRLIPTLYLILPALLEMVKRNRDTDRRELKRRKVTLHSASYETLVVHKS